MRRVLVGLVVAAAALPVASARNVIREWGGHDPNQFLVEISLQNGDDIAVHILANAQGTLEWKFEAFNSVTQQPGYINSVVIDPGRTVGGIHLSVIGRLYPFPSHYHGAAQLKALDLVTNGNGTNVLNTIDLTGNLGDNAQIYASGITGACTVGGSVMHNINVLNDISGTISIAGFLKADLLCGTLGDVAITGVGTPPSQAPSITIRDAYTHTVTAYQSVKSLTLNDDLASAGSIHLNGSASLQYLHMDSSVLYGSLTVGGNLHQADLAEIGAAGTLSALQLGSDPNDDDHFYVAGDIAGSLSANTVYTHFQVDGVVTATGSVTVNSSFDTTGTAGTFPASSLGGVDPNGVLHIGTLAGELDVTQDISGDVHIGTDLTGKLQAGAGVAGSVQIQGDLSGQLYAFGTQPLSGTVSVDGDVTAMGDIYAAGPIDGAVMIGGSLVGTLRTVADPNDMSYDANKSLRGSLTIQNDLTGNVYLGGNLQDPADPNGNLLNGHIIVNGSFKGHGGWNAAIVMMGGLTGLHPFIAVNYGLDPNAVWDPDTASVTLQYPGEEFVNGNRPDLHIWWVSNCRGETNGDGVFSVADADAFVEALSDAKGYAYDYPGLGALDDPWTDSSTRLRHADTDCSGTLDYLDLNTFMIYVPYECYTVCAGRGDTPTQLATLTGQQLLQNVADERCGALLDIEEQLAGVTDPNTIGPYWQAVLDYQTSSHALTESLNFGADPNTTTLEFEFLYAGTGALNGNAYAVTAETYGNNRTTWLTVSSASGSFTSHKTLTATVARRDLPVGDHAGAIIVEINDDPNLTLEIPVTMNKPLTNPRILACLEYYDADPNAYDKTVAGLHQWERVTDAAIIFNITDEEVAYVYPALINEFPNMTIYPGVKSTVDGCHLSDPLHWADPYDPNSVVYKVNHVAALTGSNAVFIDNEGLVRKYTDDPNGQGQPGNLYECDPNNLTLFDPNDFEDAMEAFHYALDPNIAIFWYPSVSWGTSCSDPINDPPWVMTWTQNLIGTMCPRVGPRLVSETYDGPWCQHSNENVCGLFVRDWEDTNCPALPMLPIVYIGDPNADCSDPHNNLACLYWNWNEVNDVFTALV